MMMMIAGDVVMHYCAAAAAVQVEGVDGQRNACTTDHSSAVGWLAQRGNRSWMNVRTPGGVRMTQYPVVAHYFAAADVDRVGVSMMREGACCCCASFVAPRCGPRPRPVGWTVRGQEGVVGRSVSAH